VAQIDIEHCKVLRQAYVHWERFERGDDRERKSGGKEQGSMKGNSEVQGGD
jgi:hypothetical protein